MADRHTHGLLLKWIDPDRHIFVLSTLQKAANLLKLSALQWLLISCLSSICWLSRRCQRGWSSNRCVSLLSGPGGKCVERVCMLSVWRRQSCETTELEEYWYCTYCTFTDLIINAAKTAVSQSICLFTCFSRSELNVTAFNPDSSFIFVLQCNHCMWFSNQTFTS